MCLSRIYFRTTKDVRGKYCFKSTIDFFEKLPDTNIADLIISVIAVVFLYVGKEMINPWLRRTNKLPVPIPFELILVFFNTLFSYLFNFRQFGVSVVGIIPTGFPTPRMIRFETIPDLLVAGDAISIAVVIYVITFSVAKLFAKKHNYKVNAKQDLRALVICELIVSFFGCLPCSGSLSRSTINSNMGARSQVSSWFTIKS
uniref:Sulfate_transp domain-containing protein n=1 Tax=Rhabditophanes sp. KR3021 TaxID=114890 RepID=A0AC35TH96_9BILA